MQCFMITAFSNKFASLYCTVSYLINPAILLVKLPMADVQYLCLTLVFHLILSKSFYASASIHHLRSFTCRAMIMPSLLHGFMWLNS